MGGVHKNNLQESETHEQDFNFQYGFSVEQQKERQNNGI